MEFSFIYSKHSHEGPQCCQALETQMHRNGPCLEWQGERDTLTQTCTYVCTGSDTRVVGKLRACGIERVGRGRGRGGRSPGLGTTPTQRWTLMDTAELS